MQYKQISEKPEGKGKKLTRTYRNEQTGTEVKTSVIYEDPKIGRWWAFTDLYNMPIMRTMMAKNITDLFGIGLSLNDIKKWCEEEKKLLKSNEPDKYEKLYALVLEKEKLAITTADPIKQQIALCTVYILADDERPDYFNMTKAEEKMQLWAADQGMVAFFLNWHTRRIHDYINRLDRISKIASKLDNQQQNMMAQLMQSTQSE